MKTSDNGLPYRLNVGLALFNRDGLVLIARRLRSSGPEIVLPGCLWQMPQGGIDPGEEPLETARRELQEETSVTNAAYLGEIAEWLPYDFPPYSGPPHHLSPFRGQRQKWIALRFLGEDSEIDVTQTLNGADPEFDLWRWEKLENTPDLVVPFKRDVYARVAREFSRFAGPLR